MQANQKLMQTIYQFLVLLDIAFSNITIGRDMVNKEGQIKFQQMY